MRTWRIWRRAAWNTVVSISSFEFARDVREGFRSFQGVDFVERFHWDPVKIGLSRNPSPLRGTRRRKGVDFTLIEQDWLRTATMNYCRDLTATGYL